MSAVPALIPELGVGIVYNSALEPLLREHPDLIQVLEIEPQTTWLETRNADAPYRVRPDVQARIAALPGHKLVHSIGTPVGGSVCGVEAQLPLLRQTIEQMGAPWASEHLSFNLTDDFFTGFFLPPRQTEAGVRIYVDAVQRLQRAFGVPIAIETGVNYLRPRADEMPDGEFVAAVASEADCGILLDLHNVYCNGLNGRQPAATFLASLPLDRVWEVHVAGGFEMDGFWLDAHSGEIPAPLEALCRDVIPSLPNVGAIVFELFSSFMPRFGLDATRRELERIHGLWALRRRDPRPPLACPRLPRAGTTEVTPAEWERSLGRVAIGQPASSPLDAEIAADPGAMLVGRLVNEFRASMVVGVFRLTSRLLMGALGPDVFRAMLEDFWSRTPPHQFAATEADAFAEYLLATGLRLPQMRSILEFERAALHTLQDGQPRTAKFTVDPLPMLRALADGVLLENPGQPGDYEIVVTDDGAVNVI